MGAINEHYYANTAATVAEQAMLDVNFDLKPDIYDFNITMKTNPQDIRNIKVLSFYDYQIYDLVEEEMVVMAYADVDTPIGASLVYLDGDLELR